MPRESFEGAHLILRRESRIGELRLLLLRDRARDLEKRLGLVRSLLKNASRVSSASVVPFVEHDGSCRTERIYLGNTDSGGWTVVIGSA